ncbi:MAG: sulfite exporter TauE/SafE family protein [Betaproteobacteria bacterium]|nr:sulfite exporter TauE/SafE family protein [Betaproteobacteria bacterium]
MEPISVLLGVIVLGVYTGAQNFMAGGGTFIIFPVLLLIGLDPVTASMTAAMGLFPNQLSSAHVSRRLATGVNTLSLKKLLLVSVIGGCTGSLLLSVTPSKVFSHLVPWLTLFATLLFAWGSLIKPNPVMAGPGIHEGGGAATREKRLLLAQITIAVYGGYFAAGIGFLMLAALTMSGLEARRAIATKNVLVVAITSMSFIIYALSARVNWPIAIALALGALGGSWIGAWLIQHIPNRWLKGYVVIVGLLLTLWLFLR